MNIFIYSLAVNKKTGKMWGKHPYCESSSDRSDICFKCLELSDPICHHRHSLNGEWKKDTKLMSDCQESKLYLRKCLENKRQTEETRTLASSSEVSLTGSAFCNFQRAISVAYLSSKQLWPKPNPIFPSQALTASNVNLHPPWIKSPQLFKLCICEKGSWRFWAE